VLGGGMTRVSPLAHKEAWMFGRRLLGEEPAAIDPAKLAAYLRRYNAAYVALPSGRWDGVMARLAGWRPCFEAGGQKVYAADDGELSYVAGHEGDRRVHVSARVNEIRIEGAPAGRFALKFHYLDTLRAPPGVTLFPSPVPDDPVPFLGVENPGGRASFAIVNTGSLF
jgi:hypothetical protein